MDEWLEGPELGWFETRWGIWKDPAREADERKWALAEIACAVVSVATIGLSLLIIPAAFVTRLPWWVTGWPIQLLMSGAVGYGTNFFAVQMLFKPREPYTSVPLRWIWRQGLIPAKQAEMARVVGDQVAKRLLTAEGAADEIARVTIAFFEDDERFQHFAKDLVEAARQQGLGSLSDLVPALVEAIEAPLADSVPAQKVRDAITGWLQSWLSDPRGRATLSEFCRMFLRARADTLVDLLKRMVRRYKKTGRVRSAAFSLSESTNLIDWEDLEKALRAVLVKRSGREWMERVLDELVGAAPALVETVITTEWADAVKDRFIAILREALKGLSSEEAGARLRRLFDDDPRGVELRRELRAKARPALKSWIEGGGLRTVLARFDVKGRVAEAAAALDVRQLEDMANRIGAYHLAAIQVLGYVLGILAGSLLVAINLVSGG